MFDYIEFPMLPIVRVHLVINCVLAFLTVSVVGLRLVARFVTGAGLWWDDYLILFALPQGLGMLIIQGLWAPMGIGYPVTETLPNLETILKLLVAYELIYSTAIGTIKVSVLLFYLRVFVNRGLRMATKAALAFVMLWNIGNILQVFLICRPFAKTYSLTVEGECGDQVASFIAIGAFNVISDVIILTLPLPTVWSLKMATPTKFGLTGVFLVGLVVSVIAIIRIVTLTRLDLQNLTGTMIWADFWSATEPNLGILCVSLPMLGSLLSRCLPSRRGNTKLAYHSSGNGANGSAFSKLKDQSQTDTQIPLENIYAANQEVHYQSAVGAGRTPEPLRTAPDADKDKDSGSDVALTDQPTHLSDQKNGIRVQTKWTISHN
ncbi:hypothetical protein MYCTH_2309013 [Thermothelomyces thermophilus ATCC 42464]|uniref:Rhodopsin domain-containing protein n=1 Tax=Thermothelomyces thermophilus (strain ATCC 42464 / BCRC 31852 / DSM 1799) TaxID=573729 RepID=G2QHU2_THET4|nr:uncharacterized protein MYCTH_2309013 [Thermothelomyces thermophilus ATCC 42464]AEO60131.1 hypothetical protein MYCTH_2309013 [Thermothelomyces thermophilus ATCC 42464]